MEKTREAVLGVLLSRLREINILPPRPAEEALSFFLTAARSLPSRKPVFSSRSAKQVTDFRY
jgi:hypothetical protein